MSDEQYTASKSKNNPNISYFETWSKAGWGRHMIPLANGGKAPKSETGWVDHVYLEGELLKAQALGRNLGIATGRRGQRGYTLVAFDVEASKFSARVVETVLATLGEDTPLPMRTRAGSSSTGFFLRVVDPIDGAPDIRKTTIAQAGTSKTKLVELLAEGQQFHVAGTRADHGGVELEWPGGIPVLDAVREVTLQELEDLLQAIEKGLTDDGVVLVPRRGPFVPVPATAPAPSPSHQAPECSPQELRALLDLIPNDHHFDDRDEWIKIAHALHGASNGDPEVRELWLGWCQQRDQKPGEPERVWDTIAPGTVRAGVGTIREHARRADPNGYARSLFQDDVGEHAKSDPINPGTGKPAYLAREILAEALATEVAFTGTVKSEGLGDLMARTATIKRDAPIVDDWIYRDIVHTVIAAPGVGKSLFGVHVALAAALGRDPRTNKPAPPSHVYLLMGEDSQPEVIARSRATLEHHYKIDPSDQKALNAAGTRFELRAGGHLPLLSIDPRKGTIDPIVTPGLRALADWLETVIELRDARPVTLIFDMLRHVYSGDDNSRQQVDNVWRVFKATLAALSRHGVPAGAMITHHKTKAASRSGDNAFAAAGSIGIEGNSRLVTSMETLANQEFIRATRTKTNYGTTGQETFWRKVVVPSSLGGETVYLEPTDKATALNTQPAGTRVFQLEGMVAAAHKAMLDAPAGTVFSSGKRQRSHHKNVTHVRDLIRGTPEGASASDKDLDDILDMGVTLGAWSVGRLTRQVDGVRIDVDTGVVPCETWVMPDRDAESGDAEG